MMFYTDGADRYNQGGSEAIERGQYLFAMKTEEVLKAGFSIFLDPEDQTRGEVYTHGLRLCPKLCTAVWDCLGAKAWKSWTPEDLYRIHV